MAKLNWDLPGERFFEVGVDRGVLYPRIGAGVAWNGLVSVNEKPSGGDAKPIYLDGRKTYDFVENEDFEADIEAYSAPKEFNVCNGVRTVAPGLSVTKQRRETFGFSYRTLLGNDILREDYGYKLHLVYNATSTPTSNDYKTLGENPSIDTKKWSIFTVPPMSVLYRPTAHIIINARDIPKEKLNLLESLLYGTDETEPTLPSQQNIYNILVGP